MRMWSKNLITSMGHLLVKSFWTCLIGSWINQKKPKNKLKLATKWNNSTAWTIKAIVGSWKTTLWWAIYLKNSSIRKTHLNKTNQCSINNKTWWYVKPRTFQERKKWNRNQTLTLTYWAMKVQKLKNNEEESKTTLGCVSPLLNSQECKISSMAHCQATIWMLSQLLLRMKMNRPFEKGKKKRSYLSLKGYDFFRYLCLKTMIFCIIRKGK